MTGAIAAFILTSTDANDVPPDQTKIGPSTTSAPPTPVATATSGDKCGDRDPCIQMDGIEVVDGVYQISFTPNGLTPKIDGGAAALHVHFFWGPLADIERAGEGAPKSDRVFWGPYDGPSPYTRGVFTTADKPSTATELCAAVATYRHAIVPDTGTCMPLPS